MQDEAAAILAPPVAPAGRGYRLRAKASSVARSALGLVRRLWLAYLLASVLILTGFSWGLPDGNYVFRSFVHDENATAKAVGEMEFPSLNPHMLQWGTGFLYPLYATNKAVSPVTRAETPTARREQLLVVGRVLVLLCALGAVTLVYVLGRQLFDPRTGKLAALIFSVMPGFVIYSHYLKVDIPATFVLLAAFVAAYKLIESRRFAHVVLLGLLAGFAASTKYIAATFVPAGMVAIALAGPLARKPRAYAAYLGSVAAGFLVGTPHALISFSEWRYWLERVEDISSRGAAYLPSRPPAWIDYPLHVLPLSLTLPLLLAAAAGLVWTVLHGDRRLWPVWVFLLCNLALLSGDNLRLLRYTLLLLPFAALFVAYGLSSMFETRRLRSVAAVATVGLVAYAFLFSFSYVRVMAQTDPRVQASEWFESHVPKDVPLAVSRTHYLDVPAFDHLGYSERQVELSVSKLRRAKAPYLVQSDFGTLLFQQALADRPAERRFFDYVREHYVEVAHFENSQKLWFIDSKPRDAKLSHDWLHPNPRVTVLRLRRAEA